MINNKELLEGAGKMDLIKIYSDFNGVLNINESDLTVTASVKTANSEFLARKNKITWNPETISLLQDLLGTGFYSFLWHTTWNDAGNIKNAADLVGLTGLHDYSKANLNRNAKNRKEWTKWKAESIIKDQAENPMPFIWIDDNAPIYWADYVQGNVRSPSLVVTTDSKKGLSNEEILKIVEWSQNQLRKTLAV